jgi:hypothetical protein
MIVQIFATHSMATFKGYAREALKANGYDADELLVDYVAGRRPADPLVIEHEGLKYEFKRRGISVNFELVGRILSFGQQDEPETEWLEVAFLSDH